MEQMDKSDMQITGKIVGIFLFRVDRPVHHFSHTSCANLYFSGGIESFLVRTDIGHTNRTPCHVRRMTTRKVRVPSHQKVFIVVLAFVSARVNTSGSKLLLRKDATAEL